MELSVSFLPDSECQKLIEVDDEYKLGAFYEKHLTMEIAVDALGEE